MVEEYNLNDEAINSKKSEEDKMIKETIKEINTSVTITEEDKRKAAEQKEKLASMKEDEEIAQLTADFSQFAADKISMKNDAEDIGKIPIGIDLLNVIAGGGIGIGTFTMIVGNPGTFKSALLAQTIANTQKTFKKSLSTYHDSENAMTKDRLYNMGVRNPQITPYDHVSVESIFKTIEAMASFKELRGLMDVPGIVAWDSIANTDTEKGIESDDTDINKTIGLKARILSQLFPRFLPKMKKHKISLIAINQLREKMDVGMFGSPNDLQHMGNKEIPGGQAVKFNAFHLLMLRNRGDLKFEQYGFNGIRLEAFFVKNKFFRPYVPVTLLVDFNKGISNFWSNYNFLVDNKRIKAGAWNTIFGYDEKKFRTKDAHDLYNSDAKFKQVFDSAVKEVINSNFVTQS